MWQQRLLNLMRIADTFYFRPAVSESCAKYLNFSRHRSQAIMYILQK